MRRTQRHKKGGPRPFSLFPPKSALLSLLICTRPPERQCACAPCCARNCVAKELGFMAFTLIFTSTDYLFDSTSPPYTSSSPTNLVNLYGITKRDSELTCRVWCPSHVHIAVLRVPILTDMTPLQQMQIRW
ncbi:hypothetical protein EDB85DRAFT_2048543 [Lactarius pseudohatsudake]|nr:hypothetical protein EDB85DRAFT_2048543 [Lactarius pseudohatsudake]